MITVKTTDGTEHEFSDARIMGHGNPNVLSIEKYPRSMCQEYVSFPFVNVLWWKQDQ
jgi:hypothetical protein